MVIERKLSFAEIKMMNDHNNENEFYYFCLFYEKYTYIIICIIYIAIYVYILTYQKYHFIFSLLDT